MARSRRQDLDEAYKEGASASLMKTLNDIECLLDDTSFERSTSRLRRKVRRKLKELAVHIPAESEVNCVLVKRTKKNFCFQECDEYGNPVETSRVGVLYIKKKFIGKKRNAPDFIRVGIFEWD